MDFQLLDWDSRFFGIKTAKILPLELTQGQLDKMIAHLRADGIQLVYWSAGREVKYDVTALGGRLADTKVTFQADLKSLNPNCFIPTGQIVKYQANTQEEALLDLAVQAGKHSRFSSDPQFPYEKFIDLYHEWMRKCIKGDMGDEILVIHQDMTLAGMVTVAIKQGKGDIGLIAVDAAYRGKHYGEMLVRAAQKWFINQHLETAQVVTQVHNTPACSLYKKCNYSVTKTEYLYHFWL